MTGPRLGVPFEVRAKEEVRRVGARDDQRDEQLQACQCIIFFDGSAGVSSEDDAAAEMYGSARTRVADSSSTQRMNGMAIQAE